MRLQMSNITNDNSVRLYLYNSLGEKVGSDTGCYNGEGITTSSPVVGEVYTIAVEYKYDLVNYTLHLYTDKAPVAVSGNMAVVDSIAFDDRINTDNSYDCVAVRVYDASGNMVYEDKYMYTGDFTGYTLAIQ